MAANGIVFTGGTGRAGRHAGPRLKANGCEILDVNLKPLDCPGADKLIAGPAHSGQAVNALSHRVGFDEQHNPRQTV